MSNAIAAKINARTRLSLRWSTAPRHVGYASSHEPNDLMDQDPGFEGTPKQVDAEIRATQRRVGQGTFLAIIVTVKRTGEIVDREALRQIVYGY